MKEYKKKYEDIKDKYFEREDVTGVFYGLKTKNGEITEDPALIIQVKEKKPLVDIPKKERIPKKIDKLTTDVIQGNPVPFNLYTGDNYVNTLQPGVSIGPECMGKIGTWGAIVYDLDTGDAGILSNHHVLMDKYSHLNPYIKQPGNGQVFENRIAEVHSSKYYLGTRGDYAFAPLLDFRGFDGNIYGTNQIISGAKDPEIGDTLDKVGRTTGYTQGRVLSYGSWVSDYSSHYTDSWYGNVTISGFVVAPLTDPYENIGDAGDSGSLLYNATTGIGAGLLTAGTTSGEKYVYCSLFTNALTDLGLSIIYDNSIWKNPNTSSNVGLLIPLWITSATPQDFVLELLVKNSLSNVCIFTDSQFIDSIDGGVIWIKRNDEFMPVGNRSNAYMCNIGNIEANIPVSLTIRIKRSNNLDLNGEYAIPLYVSHGDFIDVAGMGSWISFTELS